jgi:RND family efflux transporter MFP subunit
VQKDYEILRAPFDGTITARYADEGALLPAATGGTSGAQPLLEVAQLDRLRVALQLGQEDAARVRVGDDVILQIEPGEPPLRAHVSRLTQSLDPRTRTMLCEIDLLAPPAGLYPGAFVQASITLRGTPKPLVPSDSLVAQSGQLYVGLVQDNRVHLQKVRLGIDDGQNVEVLEGLRGGELIAISLGTDVPDGSPVRPLEAQAQK